MANPTTNFGWVMPTSSSLVTNLPADFNTFGQAVDTSMSELLGGTTGQVLSKTSNTNMDFTWVTPTDQTPLTTKGDLFTFTTVDARLAVGATDGMTLQVDSSTATGLKWATASSGAMTLISTTTFSGATTANIDGIFSSTYSKYQIILTGWSASASLNLHMKFRYGSTTESNANYYQTSKGINVNDTTSTLTEAGGTQMRIGTETQGPGGILNLTFVDVGTSAIQPYFSGIWSGQSTTTQLVGGTKNGTQQIYTGLQFLSSSGNVAGKITVYGLAS